MNGQAVPGLNHQNDKADRRGAEGEDLSRRRTGFIDDVFNLVHKVLQKHEIPNAFDRCSDSSADSPALLLDAKKAGAEISAPVGLTNAS